MTEPMRELSVQIRADPDIQATVTDFLDYTEFLPSDLIRSLTLIGKLDESYVSSANTLHTLTKTYAAVPSIPPEFRPDLQQLRSDISGLLSHAINARESASAEASRLYDVVDRHHNRLGSIISKLRALPQPPSRDPTPPPHASVSPIFQRRNTIERPPISADDVPHPRITLRLNSGPSAPVRGGVRGGSRGRGGAQHRHRRVTIPGEVIPAFNPDSPPPSSSDLNWEASLPPSPVPIATSRVLSGPSTTQPGGPSSSKPSKPGKLKSRKKPRPSNILGSNVHSSVAGISTINALALLRRPPPNCPPGSIDAPWLRLTAYEMAKLRKRMKKNAIWNPSETMIRRELADLGRGPEAYHAAKSKAESEEGGILFVDEENLEEKRRLGVRKDVLEEGEIGYDCLGDDGGEGGLRNRGMKLNEAKKLKKENLRREEAAVAAKEAEEAAKRVAESGTGLGGLLEAAGEGDGPAGAGAVIAASISAEEGPYLDSSAGPSPRKRKRDGSPDLAAAKRSSPLLKATDPNSMIDPRLFQTSVSPRESKKPRIKAKPTPRNSPPSTPEMAFSTTITTKVPLAPAGAFPRSPQPPTPSPIRSICSPSLSPPPPSGETTPRRMSHSVQTPKSPRPTRLGSTGILPSRSRRASTAPASDPVSVIPSRRTSSRQTPIPTSSRGPTPTQTVNATAAISRSRRLSTTPAPIAPARRGKRPTPGTAQTVSSTNLPSKLVKGRRKAAPKRGGPAALARRAAAARRRAEKGRRASGSQAVDKVMEDAVAKESVIDWEDDDDDDDDEEEVDEDEPTYCMCEDVSWGVMIACESEDCEREWFHLSCVNLEEEPRRTARWYCPDCRTRLQIGGETGLSGVGARNAPRKK